MSEDTERKREMMRRVLAKKKLMRQVLEQKKAAAADTGAPPSLQRYPEVAGGQGPLLPEEVEPEGSFAGDDSTLAAATTGFAQGATSNLAQRGAAEVASGASGESGETLAGILSAGARMNPIMALAKMAHDASGARNLRDPQPATEMLGPEGKAMLERHPEMWERFSGQTGAAPSREEALAGVQQTLADRQAESPGAYTGGDIAGSLAQAYYGGKALGPMMSRVGGGSAAGIKGLDGGARGLARAKQLAAGTAAATAGGAAEAGVRSAANTKAGEDVDLAEVAGEAGTTGLISGGLSLAFPLAGAAGKKAWKWLRNPRTESGLALQQLENAGGKMGFIGPKTSKAKEVADELEERFINESAPASVRERLAVRSPANKVANELARKKVVPAIAEEGRRISDEIGAENGRYYETIPGKTKVLAANALDAMEDFIKKGQDVIDGKETPLPFLKMENIKAQFERLQARNGLLDAREFDDVLGGLADDIGYAKRTGQGNPRLEKLYAALKEDMKRFDEVDAFVRQATKDGIPEAQVLEMADKIAKGSLPGPQIPEGGGTWSRLKKKHAQMKVANEDARAAFNIPGRHLAQDPDLDLEQIHRNVTQKLEGFRPGDDDAQILRHARRLGLLDDVQAARQEAGAARLSNKFRIVGSQGGASAVGNVRGLATHLDPLARWASRQAQAQKQAAGGIFLGTEAERHEQALVEMPQSVTDYLTRVRQAQKRKERETQ